MEDQKESITNDPLSQMSEVQRNQIKQFMDFTGNSNVQTAISYLEMSDNDTNRAVELFLGEPHTSSTDSPVKIHSSSSDGYSPGITHNAFINKNTNNNSQFNLGIDSNMDKELKQALFDSNFPPLKLTKNQSEKGSQIKPSETSVKEFEDFLQIQKQKSTGIFHSILSTTSGAIKQTYNSLMPISIRGETPGGEEFVIFTQKQYSKFDTFNYNIGNFKQNLEKSTANMRPLLVQVFCDDKNYQQEIIDLQLTLMKDPELRKYINQKFHVLGILSNSTEIQNIQKHVEEQNWPCFIVFQTDLFDQVHIVDFVTIDLENSDVKYYQTQLEGMMNQFYILLSEQSLIQQEAEKRKETNIFKSQIPINPTNNLNYINHNNQNSFGNQYGFDNYDGTGYYPAGTWGRQNSADIKKRKTEEENKRIQDQIIQMEIEEEHQKSLLKTQEIMKMKEQEERKLQEKEEQKNFIKNYEGGRNRDKNESLSRRTKP